LPPLVGATTRRLPSSERVFVGVTLAVVPGKLYAAHLNLITHTATKACLEQRQELDLVRNRRERERELREEAQWGRGH
jgi:hypothetical protein